MMQRLVEPELLDELPSAQAEAQASRRDLRRINALMGHIRIFQRAWGEAEADDWCSRIIDLGGGDGTLLLKLARQVTRTSRVRSVVIVDRQPIVSHETRDGFESLGWKVIPVAADVFEWLSEARAIPQTFLIANLFLHHFEGESLRKLLRLIPRQCEGFAACEPRRSSFSLVAAHLLGLIGCNRVTRHDAVASVRAGFRGRELTQAWSSEAGWEPHERAAGLFSHLFWGRKIVH